MARQGSRSIVWLTMGVLSALVLSQETPFVSGQNDVSIDLPFTYKSGTYFEEKLHERNKSLFAPCDFSDFSLFRNHTTVSLNCFFSLVLVSDS